MDSSSSGETLNPDNSLSLVELFSYCSIDYHVMFSAKRKQLQRKRPTTGTRRGASAASRSSSSSSKHWLSSSVGWGLCTTTPVVLVLALAVLVGASVVVVVVTVLRDDSYSPLDPADSLHHLLQLQSSQASTPSPSVPATSTNTTANSSPPPTKAPTIISTSNPTHVNSSSIVEQWILQRRNSTKVNCGGHFAPSCFDCPQGHGAMWCHGDCVWTIQNHNLSSCQPRKPSPHIHWAYPLLLQEYPFHAAVTEDGQYVNILMVRAPLNELHLQLFQHFQHQILFLGISSFENYPRNSPNPYSNNFTESIYRNLFPGFLTMFRDASTFFQNNTATLLLSQSDFNLDAALQFGRKNQLPKIYDFVYSGSDQEVHNNCVGWSSFAKNWSFVLEALQVMCDDHLFPNFTGVLAATKDKQGQKACTIPDKCQGKIIQTSFLTQKQFFTYAVQSKFVFLPQIYDASPRVAAQALSLNVPILLNQNIVGGWKYLNDQTGEFFHDMSNFPQQLRKLLQKIDNQQYEPRKFMEEHYGNEKSGRIFRLWVEEHFPQVVFPNNRTRLLLPLWK